MSFSLFPALFAGLMATVAMSLVAEGASLKDFTAMPSMSFVIGSAFSGDQDEAMLVGNLVHFALLGTVLYGIGYALALSVLDASPLLVGAGVGMVHGALIGIALGMVDTVHPRLVDPARPEVAMASAKGSTAIRIAVDRSEVVAVRPGTFGVNWGEQTPVVIMASYTVFGVVFAFLYSALS